jgi:imidazolonepropionase-like amidohydrolase
MFFDKIVVTLVAFTLTGCVFNSRTDMPRDLPNLTSKMPIAIDNVHLITMNGEEVQRDKQLLIKGGLIVGIRLGGTEITEEYDVIDGRGSYVLPGLIDMHVHVMDQKYLVLSLAYGVTSVRNMGGYPMHLRWKKELAEGKWLGSNLYSSSPILNGDKYSDPFMHKVVVDSQSARTLVQQYKQDGWDFIKVYENLDAKVYNAIIDEANKLDFPVAGHAPYSIIENRSSIAQLASFEHAEEIYDGLLNYTFNYEKLEQVAHELRVNNITVTPTLSVFDHLTKISEHKKVFVDSLPTEYLNPFFKFTTDTISAKRWLNASKQMTEYNLKLNNFQQYIVKTLYKHKVNMLVGTDWGALYMIPGMATHDEMALMHNAGMSSFDVLKAATTNASKVLGLEDKIGRINEGIMVSDNPLEKLDVLRKPEAVIKDGQFLNEKFLIEMKESAKIHSSFFTSLGRVLDFLISK